MGAKKRRGGTVFDLAREHRLAPIAILPAATPELAGALLELAWDGHRVLACARLGALLAGSADGVLVGSDALAGDLASVLEAARSIGARGIVARDRSAPYPRDARGWHAVPCAGSALAFDRSLSPPPAVTNADKVLYPRDGITKREIVAYYGEIASVLLPYLALRPLVCQRWPDGIDGFTWYQHRMPPRAPDYLRAVRIEEDRRIVVEDARGLAWLANQAALTFHGWASRVGTLACPDWVVIDLDPGEATTWPALVRVALALRRLLELLELPSVPKTSGQRGLHVLVPLAPGQSTAEAHELARRIAKTLVTVLPEDATIASARAERGGRLFVDHLQNFVGKTLVLPYSLRAVDGAPVSTPLAWDEVRPDLDPRAFDLRTIRRRLDRVGDLAAPLLAGTARIAPALERLAR